MPNRILNHCGAKLIRISKFMSLGKINLITPPDKLFNLNPGILLIKPSVKVKMHFQQLLSQTDEDINVYIFDTDETNIEWMLSVCQQADIIIVDIDNCDNITKSFVSFMLAQPNVHYMTSDENTPYNLISRNRIYNLDWILDTLKEDNEEDDATED